MSDPTKKEFYLEKRYPGRSFDNVVAQGLADIAATRSRNEIQITTSGAITIATGRIARYEGSGNVRQWYANETDSDIVTTGAAMSTAATAGNDAVITYLTGLGLRHMQV